MLVRLTLWMIYHYCLWLWRNKVKANVLYKDDDADGYEYTNVKWQLTANIDELQLWLLYVTPPWMDSLVQRVDKILQQTKLPTAPPKTMAVDKKVADGKLRLILLKGALGNCVFTGFFAKRETFGHKLEQYLKRKQERSSRALTTIVVQVVAQLQTLSRLQPRS